MDDTQSYTVIWERARKQTPDTLLAHARGMVQLAEERLLDSVPEDVRRTPDRRQDQCYAILARVRETCKRLEWELGEMVRDAQTIATSDMED